VPSSGRRPRFEQLRGLFEKLEERYALALEVLTIHNNLAGTGLEQPHDFPGKSAEGQKGGTKGGAPASDLKQFPPHEERLAPVIAAWPDLPDSIRARILKMVQAPIVKKERNQRR